MVAIAIMEGICVAAVVFMICFLAVLFRESKPKSSCHVVYLSSRHTPSEHDALGLITEAETRSASSDTRHRSRFEVLAGGAELPTRRVG